MLGSGRERVTGKVGAENHGATPTFLPNNPVPLATAFSMVLNLHTYHLMASTIRVAVLGGGVTGLSAAYHLRFSCIIMASCLDAFA
jgi:hypothetical protein